MRYCGHALSQKTADRFAKLSESDSGRNITKKKTSKNTELGHRKLLCFVGLADQLTISSPMTNHDILLTCPNWWLLSSGSFKAIFNRVSKVNRDWISSALLCTVIGPENSRFRQFACFSFESSLALQGIFPSPNWPLLLLLLLIKLKNAPCHLLCALH